MRHIIIALLIISCSTERERGGMDAGAVPDIYHLTDAEYTESGCGLWADGGAHD